ncbi:putative isomerase YbhE [Hesseltinella vesiculosa]|uniref:Putative isomerase YbhE n=1 Tax=Hesseltinella vesiculosa TaxID=101127 RepID=A0A1X2G9T4_9FUNG|nr:putative isomerase YbhE [Hesseltinella vesiculosa]
MTHPVYVSGYTKESGKGIYLYDFDANTGDLLNGKLVAECENPSFLALHPSSQQLISVNETDSYQDRHGTGFISAYRRDEQTGMLSLVNTKASEGSEPCHATIWGHYVFVANYTGGTTSLFSLSSNEGLSDPCSVIDHAKQGLKPTMGVPDRQEAPHCHAVDLDHVERRKVIVMDLGCDLATLYSFDAHADQELGTMHLDVTNTQHFQFPKGTGPRHIAFAPNMRSFAYVMGELTNELFMLELDLLQNKFHLVQRISALPPDVTPTRDMLGAEITVAPNGRYLYTTIRGHDSVSVFYIDDRTGKLSFVQNVSTHGKHPRHFTIDPTGTYLLVGNQHSNNIAVFSIENGTGHLTFVKAIDHPEPACIQFWT